MVNCDFSLQDTSVGIWNRERLATVLYKAVKHEDVEIAAKCLRLGIVDVNTRYEPVRNILFNIFFNVYVVDAKS